MSTDRSGQIHWLEWGNDAFELAVSEDKLVLLDIGASWCHWCHVMDRTTYSDPEVIRIVNERFIPVRVESDRLPHIQDRYLLGGWPTTAFLLPDGEMLSGATFIPPEAMILKLREVDTFYNENRELATMQVASMEAEVEADRTEAEIPSAMPDGEVIRDLEKLLRNNFDSRHGGFDREPKFPYPEAISFAFLRHRKTGDSDMLHMALKTLDGMMGICDPVWGGFYRYSVTHDWSQPHYEKLLYMQARAMDNYLEAYQVSADDKYGAVAAGIKSYMTRFLSDDERGGFYASQDADVGSHDPNAELVFGEDYFPKDEADRLAVGVPYVDKTVFIDWNGMMVSSYLKLSQVMGDRHALDFALKTVDRLIREGMCNGGICHYLDDGPKLPGVLSDQVYFGLALVDAYQASGVRQYLDRAEKLVGFMEAELEDVVDGGFYFRPFDPHSKIEQLERHKPFYENTAAVRLFVKLNCLTGKDMYGQLAERTLTASSLPQVTESIVGLALGLAQDRLTNPPTHIVLVGGKDDKRMQAMLQAALHAYDPGKLVQLLDPAEDALRIGEVTYKAHEGPVAYVCAGKTCSRPVGHVEELVELLSSPRGMR